MSDTIGPIDASELLRQPIGTTREAPSVNAIPDTPPTIPPALTNEEWSARHRTWVERDARHGVEIRPDGRIGVHDTAENQTVPQGELAALIALSNHALPDTDPRKITREMVDALKQTIKDAQAWQSDRVIEGENNVPLTRSLLSALAALLPPDGA